MPSPALSVRWVQKREAHWARLEALVAACKRRNVGALSTSDLRELAQLYRQTAADLATAREDPSSRRLAAYLNQLLGRAHNLVYAGHRRERRGLLRFYTRTFPQTFRGTWRYTAAAVAILAVGALAGAVLAATSPGFERFILGGEMLDTIERREMWTHSILPIKPLASAGITANNLSVSIIAYASGILAGLGTFYIMATNGLLLGVLGTICHQAGMSVALWSFVAPHGTLELPAIVIAGGAGLIVARSLVVASDRPRRECLVDAGRVSLRLFGGVVPMLLIAGLIEGFVSPTGLEPSAKFLIGSAMFVLLVAYLGFAGRGKTVASVTSQ
ncbi:MAG: stage II sporulation protein M [Vicinamibacteraceae bacterium]